MAYSIGLTAGVVYDEDTDIYQMTSGLANELGKVVFDIDPVTSYSFNYSTQINANPTGDYAGSNGYFETRFGDTENGVTFFMDHSENGADLYVHHNSYLISNLEIPNFKFNVPQTMEINCVENTFIMTYDDVFIGDVYCSSNILFNDGWLEFTACNVIGTTAILDSYNYEPNFTVTHTARFMNGIQADDWDGIMLEHIGDCWWSNVDPENSSNMHTMGMIGIGTTDPIYNLHVEGTIYASSYCNIALCEEALRVQVPIGSIMSHVGGNEYISDPTFHKIVGQTVLRADFIELANSLGIPKSQTTFLVPALTTDWMNVVNKPTIPSAQVNCDWNATSGIAQILNKPTIPASQTNADWNATSGVAQILNKPTMQSAQVNSDWNATNIYDPATILNKPSQTNADWNATSGIAQILNKPTLNIDASGTLSVSSINVTSSFTNANTGLVGVYWNQGYQGQNGVLTPALSFKAPESILVKYLYLTSDQRIKESITLVEHCEASKIIAAMKPCLYGYRDKLKSGRDRHYGFVAQDVEPLVPSAVYTHPDFAPTVMQRAKSVTHLGKISIIELKDHGFAVDDMIKCYIFKDDREEEIETTVLHVCGDAFEVARVSSECVFVYGQKIDVKHVNYNAFIPLLVATVQSLQREMSELRSKL